MYRLGVENQPKYVKMGVIITAIVLVFIPAGIVQAQELIIQQHEDMSITLKNLNGTELKGFANVEALSGANGLSDIIEQMGEWIN